ncbi:hypothetical protein HMPREF1210_03344 [Paenisporosarcina sp. HGH0030]|nr:hypothetical protein HMPREF1210_03344 [Paenisporosarcina sp. HGH0030]
MKTISRKKGDGFLFDRFPVHMKNSISENFWGLLKSYRVMAVPRLNPLTSLIVHKKKELYAP